MGSRAVVAQIALGPFSQAAKCKRNFGGVAELADAPDSMVVPPVKYHPELEAEGAQTLGRAGARCAEILEFEQAVRERFGPWPVQQHSSRMHQPGRPRVPGLVLLFANRVTYSNGFNAPLALSTSTSAREPGSPSSGILASPIAGSYRIVDW